MNKRLIEATILIVITLLIILFIDVRYRQSHMDDKSDMINLPAYEPNMEYGIVVDSLVIYRDKIKRNQF